MGLEVGGRFKKEEKRVYMWLIHNDIWQKPTQHCKAIVIQLKINEKKKDYHLELKGELKIAVTEHMQLKG